MSKILIVEDEILIADRLGKDLEEAEYQIAGVCRTGEESLKLVDDTHPDLILMDIRLAGKMNGIEAARQISDQYSIPIIFITDVSARVNKEEFHSALATLPANYITKPFRTDQLLAAIQQAFYSVRTLPVNQFNEHYVLLKQGTGWIKVAYEDITWLEADGSYCNIHFKSEKKSAKLSYSLNNALKVIRSNDILRIHKSHAININHLERLEGNQIMIEGKFLSIGTKYQAEIKNRLNKF